MKATKEEMIEFINSFEKYHCEGYSYNVKIYHLPITREQREVLYDALETEEYFLDIQLALDALNEEIMSTMGTHDEKRERRHHRVQFTTEEHPVVGYKGFLFTDIRAFIVSTTVRAHKKGRIIKNKIKNPS
jgi:hypothetical protein